MLIYNIAVVDNNKPFTEGITYYIENVLKHKVVECFDSGESLLEYPHPYNFDMILIDLQMPGINGLETARRFIWKYRHIPLIALTAHEENTYLVEIVAAGFKGIIFKRNVYNELNSALEKVSNGDMVFPKEIKIK